jgi:hypothetical protein
MTDKPDTAAHLTFVAQNSTVFCAIIFDVANPPFSQVPKADFRGVFCMGCQMSAITTPVAGEHVMIKHAPHSLDYLVGLNHDRWSEQRSVAQTGDFKNNFTDSSRGLCAL